MSSVNGQAKAGAPAQDILRMEHITKIYGNGFIANNGIDFSVRKGEIHALAGENGAGKSTLMKVLFGEETPEEGRILYKGEEVHITSPLTAIKMGIGMVHQHFMLVPSMTVAENMVLGMEPRKMCLMSMEKAVQLTREVAEKYALPIDPHARVQDLPVGLKQRVEILKALLRGADVLILDEPTAVLTPQETVEIFVELKRLREMGHTVIFISHKLNEIKEICDRITVIRDGRTVAVRNVADVTEQDISRMMVGRDVMLDTNKRPAKPGEAVLCVKDVSWDDAAGRSILKHISFSVRKGEILGVAGIEGNGQNELSELITGMKKLLAGGISIAGQDIAGRSIRQIRELGVSHISQDRMTYGVVGTAGVAENIIADRYYKPEFNRGPLLDNKKIDAVTDALIKEYGVKCDDRTQPVSMLSGGNMQKVVVAREFSSAPKLVVANQPTRGIDVGAAELVRNKLVELRDAGAAVMLISADLTEVMELSDDIIVLCGGEVVAWFDSAHKPDAVELGEYMLGMKKMQPQQIRGAMHEEQDH